MPWSRPSGKNDLEIRMRVRGHLCRSFRRGRAPSLRVPRIRRRRGVGGLGSSVGERESGRASSPCTRSLGEPSGPRRCEKFRGYGTTVTARRQGTGVAIARRKKKRRAPQGCFDAVSNFARASYATTRTDRVVPWRPHRSRLLTRLFWLRDEAGCHGDRDVSRRVMNTGRAA
jgi:hypothetical protein